MKLSEVILRGTRAAQPVATAVPAGTIYYVTDEQVTERSTNVVWEDISDLGGGASSSGSFNPVLTPPVDGDFAWTNQGGASVSAVTSSILLSGPATAGDSLRIRRQAAPSAPWTLTAYIQPETGDQTSGGATYGLGFRQSSDGKLHLLMADQHDTPATGKLYSIKFTNETTFSATYTESTYGALNINSSNLPIRWFKIEDNNTNRICSWSVDGITYTVFHTIGRTDFLTADQILFFVNSADASIATSVRLWHWLEA